MTDDLVKRLRERQRRTQMTEDLVKRLRDRDAYAKSNGNDYNLDNQAADRIEELQAALLSIANTPIGREIPDRTTIWGLAVYMRETATDALKEGNR